MAPTLPQPSRPILVPHVTVARAAKSPLASPPKRYKVTSLILAELAAEPRGPFDLHDEQRRRLVYSFPAHMNAALYSLCQTGEIELVELPCLCGRRSDPVLACNCPLGAWRLSAPAPRSNLIEAAHRFRRAG